MPLDKNMSHDEMVKELMHSYYKNGKIGNTEPRGVEHALKIANAVAYNIERSKDVQEIEEGIKEMSLSDLLNQFESLYLNEQNEEINPEDTKFDRELLYGYIGGRLELAMDKDMVAKICHSGSNDDVVDEVKEMPKIRKQLDAIPEEELRRDMRWVGLDKNQAEFDSLTRPELESYLVWIAAWSIFEDEEYSQLFETDMSDMGQSPIKPMGVNKAKNGSLRVEEDVNNLTEKRYKISYPILTRRGRPEKITREQVEDLKTAIISISDEIRVMDKKFYGSDEEIEKYNGKEYDMNVMGETFNLLHKKNKDLYNILLDLGLEAAWKRTKSFYGPNDRMIFDCIYSIMLDIIEGSFAQPLEEAKNEDWRKSKHTSSWQLDGENAHAKITTLTDNGYQVKIWDNSTNKTIGETKTFDTKEEAMKWAESQLKSKINEISDDTVYNAIAKSYKRTKDSKENNSPDLIKNVMKFNSLNNKGLRRAWKKAGLEDPRGMSTKKLSKKWDKEYEPVHVEYDKKVRDRINKSKLGETLNSFENFLKEDVNVSDETIKQDAIAKKIADALSAKFGWVVSKEGPYENYYIGKGSNPISVKIKNDKDLQVQLRANEQPKAFKNIKDTIAFIKSNMNAYGFPGASAFYGKLQSKANKNIEREKARETYLHDISDSAQKNEAKISESKESYKDYTIYNTDKDTVFVNKLNGGYNVWSFGNVVKNPKNIIDNIKDYENEGGSTFVKTQDELKKELEEFGISESKINEELTISDMKDAFVSNGFKITDKAQNYIAAKKGAISLWSYVDEKKLSVSLKQIDLAGLPKDFKKNKHYNQADTRLPKDKEGFTALLKTISESKINEISAELATKTYDKRKRNWLKDAEAVSQAMKKRFEKDPQYKPDKELQDLKDREEKSFDKLVKSDKLTRDKRINEISDKLAGKVVSKRMKARKAELDKLNDMSADVNKAQADLMRTQPNTPEAIKAQDDYDTKMDNYRQALDNDVAGQKANKLFKTVRKRGERLNRKGADYDYFKRLQRKGDKLDEISNETTRRVAIARKDQFNKAYNDMFDKVRPEVIAGTELPNEEEKEILGKRFDTEDKAFKAIKRLMRRERNWINNESLKEDMDDTKILSASYSFTGPDQYRPEEYGTCSFYKTPENKYYFVDERDEDKSELYNSAIDALYFADDYFNEIYDYFSWDEEFIELRRFMKEN